ncbi:MAG: hypothetical protein IKJ98_07340 [Bacteroidales bacterium]|nr:hypothetical protein [Bacteroidales bacterium]
MKRIITCFVIMVSVILSAFSQIPQTFSYQAVVRDSENNLVAEKKIVVHVQILQGSDDGSIVYTEKHVVTTNQNGLMTFELGGGETNRDFSSIDWSKAPYFIRTITDINGQIIEGVTPVLAVPYALYAAKAGNAEVDLSEYAKKSNIPELMSDYAKLADVESIYAKKSDLSNYALSSDLDDYAMISQINDFAKIVDVTSTYAKISELNNIETIMNTILKNMGKLGIDGSLKAKFSVSDNKQVYFSQGNLQYQASSGRWRFAEHQWDYVGTQTSDNYGNRGGTVLGSDNSNISSTYNGWIDLFGWGTSGYDDKYPYMTNEYPGAYGDYGESYGFNNDDISKTNYDWGYYNAIINGGNESGIWRTITSNEMDYLLNKRPDAENKKGVGIVNNVLGLILLPDDWTQPSGLSAFNSNLSEKNTYTIEQWSKMEANGAVFFPAAGYRYGTKINNVGANNNSYYWTSSIESTSVGCLCDPKGLSFFYIVKNSNMYAPDFLKPGMHAISRNCGCSVRLVKDVK